MGKTVVGRSRVTVSEPLYQKPLCELTLDEFKRVQSPHLKWKGKWWGENVKDFVKYIQELRANDLFLRFAKDWHSFCLIYFCKPSQFIDALLQIAHSLDDNDWSWVQIENKVNAQLKSEGCQSVLTDAKIEQILDERSEGKTQREIAKAVKVSRSVVSRVLKIHDLDSEGKTSAEIATIVEVSIHHVNLVLARNYYTYNSCEPDIISLKQQGTSSEYRQARLDRDHPKLAQRVRQGEITLASACKEVGIAKRMIAEFKIDEDRTPCSLAKSMTERLPLEFINDLYSELGKLIQEHHNEHNWIP